MAETKPASARFEQRDIAAKADFRGANYEPNTSVTKAERDALVRYRARPQPELRPTPRGSVYVDLAAEGEKMRERRINHIDTRLRVADHQLRLDRLRATTKGHTKARFNAKAQSQDKGHER